MTEVFADTFCYIALLNPSDRYHAAAVQATQTLHSPLVTTVWILVEVADVLCSPAVRQRTHRFLQHLRADPSTTLIADLSPWLEDGMSLYANRPDKSWSLTDCISFQVMTRRGIADALTGDHHFAQAGFRPLLQMPSA